MLRALRNQLDRGPSQRGRGDFLNERKKTGKLGQQNKQIQLVAQRPGVASLLRMAALRFDVGVKSPLEARDQLVKPQYLGSGWMRHRKFLRAIDPFVPPGSVHSFAGVF